MLTKVIVTERLQEQVEYFDLAMTDVKNAAKRGRETRVLIEPKTGIRICTDAAARILVMCSHRPLKKHAFLAVPVPSRTLINQPPIDVLRKLCKRFGRVVTIGGQTGKFIEHVGYHPSLGMQLDPIDETPAGHILFASPFICVRDENLVDVYLAFALDLTELREGVMSDQMT